MSGWRWRAPWPKQAPKAERAVAAERGPDERDPGRDPSLALPQRRIRLILEIGKAKGRVVEVSRPRFLIGRDQRCHLRPNSNAISRLHAAIDQREGRVFIRDFGSASGTTLNGRSLHDEEAEVFHGDRLQIDVLLFTISIEDQVGRPRPQALDESLDLLLGGPATDPHAATMIMKIPDLTAPAASPPASAPRIPRVLSSPPGDPPKKHRHLKYEDVRDVAVVTVLTPDLSEDFDIGSVRIELEALLEQTQHHRMILMPGPREVDVTGLRGDAAGARPALQSGQRRDAIVPRLSPIEGVPGGDATPLAGGYLPDTRGSDGTRPGNRADAGHGRFAWSPPVCDRGGLREAALNEIGAEREIIHGIPDLRHPRADGVPEHHPAARTDRRAGAGSGRVSSSVTPCISRPASS